MNCMIGYIVIVFSKKDYDFVQEILKNFSNNYFKDEFNKRTGFCLVCLLLLQRGNLRLILK